MTNPLGLDELEIASGIVFGEDPTAAQLAVETDPGRARGAFEVVVQRALARPPCVVTFSGGRDSSTVLAVAVDIARREGLPLPIAFTHRFPNAASTEESDWQERVVRHLGISDWIRASFDDELDCLGPIATRELRRHGLLWPANVHSVVPAVDAAGAGSVVMGTGGDEVLHPGRYAHLAAVLAARTRPEVRDLARAAFAVAPAPLRRRRRRPEGTWVDCPWLRPAAEARVRDRFAAMAAREPVRRQRWVRWIWRMRSLQLTLRGMEALAADQGTLLVSPFLAPEFLAAYAAWTADSPPQTRTEAVREVAAGLLPDAVLERRTKATFDGAFWGRHSRGFAASLDAAEIDSDLVDGERALAFWAAGGTDTAGPIPSSTLLQALWLERESRSRVERREERAAGSVACDPVAAATQL